MYDDGEESVEPARTLMLVRAKVVGCRDIMASVFMSAEFACTGIVMSDLVLIVRV